jgi:hypothetical protein
MVTFPGSAGPFKAADSHPRRRPQRGKNRGPDWRSDGPRRRKLRACHVSVRTGEVRQAIECRAPEVSGSDGAAEEVAEAASGLHSLRLGRPNRAFATRAVKFFAGATGIAKTTGLEANSSRRDCFVFELAPNLGHVGELFCYYGRHRQPAGEARGSRPRSVQKTLFDP